MAGSELILSAGYDVVQTCRVLVGKVTAVADNQISIVPWGSTDRLYLATLVDRVVQSLQSTLEPGYLVYKQCSDQILCVASACGY